MNPIHTLLQSPRPLLMGILNVTPDSFSDGGRHFHPDQALAQAGRMLAEGADIIDVGGESTRPGADAVPAGEQIARVVPVIQTLRAQYPDCAISVDTTLAAVAAAALDAGADMVNDVSAGRDDAAMFALIAARGVPYCLMHRQGDSKTMQDNPHYENVVEEVLAFLLERAEQAEAAGIQRGNLVIDPGIGFGKRRQDNLDLLAGLARFTATAYPVLLGTSRKRFMGAICQVESRREAESPRLLESRREAESLRLLESRREAESLRLPENPGELMPATVATTALGVMAGVKIFRVHDVRENRQAADITWAIYKAHGKETPTTAAGT
ncbi:MAG: dihydropteroate synthase [Methylococcaceae bacterium]|nr:MAG: dihydropteroate synthase [Methylococcaceae bacterium]